MANIIHWNCRSYHRQADDIMHLLESFHPHCLCLQETRLQANHTPVLQNYTLLRKDSEQENSGGVAILVRRQTPHTQVNLTTPLQAVAIRVSLGPLVTVCTVYLPPSVTVSTADLIDLLQQLPTPLILCGDFNGRSILWGYPDTNARGTLLEKFISDNNLTL